jgi:hypothetical protein
MDKSKKRIANTYSEWQHIIVLFVASVFTNYIWELLQSPFYSGMQINAQMFGHCFLASLGDGVIVLLIYFIDWLIFRRLEWLNAYLFRRLVITGVIGFIIGVTIEWIGVNILHRWSYNNLMPVISGLHLGLVPILQMVILPPIIFLAVGNWWLSKKRHSNYFDDRCTLDHESKANKNPVARF